MVGSLVASGVVRAESFSYAGLEDLIRAKNLLTVEDVMANLPTAFKQHYVLVYSSRSLQAPNVSPFWPRIVLYGEDASFVVALAKNPRTEPASNLEDALETMQFDAASRQFQLRRLVFDGVSNPFDRPVIVNPPECTHCHKADPRPNWDPYNIWPGVYGSLARSGCATMQAGTDELRNYQRFMTEGRHLGRYQYLPAPTGAGDCPNDPRAELTVANGTSTAPASELGDLIFIKNRARLQRLIESSPKFPAFKFLWAGLVKQCVNPHQPAQIEEFFPPGYARAHGLKSFAQAAADNAISAKAEFARRKAFFLRNNRGSAVEPSRVPVNFLDPDDSNATEFIQSRIEATLLKLTAERSGLDTSDWTPMLVAGSFAAPAVDLSAGDIWLQWPYLTSTGLDLFSCEELRAQSVAAIAAGH